MSQLLLFGTAGCHLCEEAERLLAAFPNAAYETVDIAEQDEWQARYAIKIPVLLNVESGTELCWPFAAADLAGFLQHQPPSFP